MMATMSEAAKKPRVPYEEYLRQERLEQQKHEWIDGEVYAMTYPDLAIVCGRPEADPDALTNPTMIVEVLSPSTEAYHRVAASRSRSRASAARSPSAKSTRCQSIWTSDE